MPFGYHGVYLRIDLTRGSADRVPLSELVLRQHIGGSGLGARLLLDEGGATADPLSVRSLAARSPPRRSSRSSAAAR
jgi:aldehyde:ferredoxin oxidoreductase